MAKSNVRYFLAGFGSFAIWGFFSIPLRNLRTFPSQEILHYRIFASLIFLCAIILLFRKRQLKADINFIGSMSGSERRTVLLQISVASIFLMLNWFSYIYAVNHVSLTSAAFAYMVCPLLTAFGGFVVLKEELSKVKLISLIVALVSVTLLATGSVKEVAWSVIIAMFFAVYQLIQRKTQGLDKLNILAVQVGLAVLVTFPFYLHQYNGLPQGAWFWSNIIIVAVFFTIIPLFLNLYALIGLPSSTLGIMIYINPIIAFAVAVLYFDAIISAFQLYAYLLLLFSVFLFNWKAIKDIFTLKEKINT